MFNTFMCMHQTQTNLKAHDKLKSIYNRVGSPRWTENIQMVQGHNPPGTLRFNLCFVWSWRMIKIGQIIKATLCRIWHCVQFLCNITIIKTNPMSVGANNVTCWKLVPWSKHACNAVITEVTECRNQWWPLLHVTPNLSQPVSCPSLQLYYQ